MSRLHPEFAQRPVAAQLQIHGVVARDDAVPRLIHRLLADTDERLATLLGVAADGVLALVGPEPSLPWVDGLIHLRRHPAAAGLLLPTTVHANVPADALLSALLGLDANLRPPLVALPDRRHVLSLADALPPDRPWLTEALEGHGD